MKRDNVVREHLLAKLAFALITLSFELTLFSHSRGLESLEFTFRRSHSRGLLSLELILCSHLRGSEDDRELWYISESALLLAVGCSCIRQREAVST